MSHGSHGHGWSRFVLTVRHYNLPQPLLLQRSTHRYENNGLGKIVVSCCRPSPYIIFRDSQGFILVYSVSSRATFERLEEFRQVLMKAKRDQPVFMLVGNKCDAQYEREISSDEGRKLASRFGCQFLEVSAKTAYNVDQAFSTVVRLLRQTRRFGSGLASSGLTSSGKDKRCLVM